MAFGDLARQDDYGIDPLTGVPFASSPQAQGKFGRIADAIVGGLKNWIETPGRAMRERHTPEDAYGLGAGTAFGMLPASERQRRCWARGARLERRAANQASAIPPDGRQPQRMASSEGAGDLHAMHIAARAFR